MKNEILEIQNPIIFIHGLGGGSYEYKPVINFIEKNLKVKIYEFTYARRFGQVSLNDIARELSEYINNNVKEGQINIIAFSQGGIVARSYITNYSDKKIDKCITVCTPHNGSFFAYFLFLKGIKELRPKSLLLRNLDIHKASYYSVYNPLDLVVFPGISAKFKHAKENKKVFALLHKFTFTNKNTLEFILNVLKV